MAFTYNPDLESDRDKVRYLIGDTDEDDFLLSDEQIAFQLAEHGSDGIYLAASYACESIAAQFARYANMSADDVKVNPGDTYDQYMKLAHRLKDLAGSMGQALPYFGGASKAERRKDDNDADLIPLHFRSHIHDNPDRATDTHASQAELAPDQ